MQFPEETATYFLRGGREVFLPDVIEINTTTSDMTSLEAAMRPELN
jgi:hypothetical protein